MKFRAPFRDVVEQGPSSSYPVGANLELLRVIEASASATEQADRSAFYEMLLRATLVVAIEEHPIWWRFGRSGSEATCPVPIKGYKATSGKRLLTAFTDTAAMRNYFAVIPYWIQMPGDAYIKLIAPLAFDELVINPYDPKRKLIRPGCTVTREEVLALAAQASAH